MRVVHDSWNSYSCTSWLKLISDGFTRNSSLILLTTHVDQWICERNHDSSLHCFMDSSAAENNFIPSLGKSISEDYQSLHSFIFQAGELHGGYPFSPEEPECSMLLTPSASTHLGPGELGNGTEATPYPACPGKFHTRSLCAVFHLLKATTTVTM